MLAGTNGGTLMSRTKANTSAVRTQSESNPNSTHSVLLTPPSSANTYVLGSKGNNLTEKSVPRMPLMIPPEGSSPLTPNENEVAEEKLNPSSLKTVLGLDDWNCGGCTQQNKPCKNPVLGKNKARVTAQIESRLGLTKCDVRVQGCISTPIK